MNAEPSPPGLRALVPLASVLLASAALTACSSPAPPRPEPVARSYLAGWAGRDWAAMRRLAAAPPADFTSVNAAALAALGVRRASYTAGPMRTSGTSASERVTQRLRIPGIGMVTFRTVLRLVQRSGKWRVTWSPATVAPGLRPGDRLSLQVTWPPRAPILGAGGAPLTIQAPLVTIGVEGQRVKNPASLTAALVAAGATRGHAATALAAAKREPTWFEPVLTVSLARYQQLRPKIYPVPGTVFQTAATRTAATPGLAAHVVGTVGPVTAAQLHALGPPYTAQSVVGQTGLELADERQLAGSPGATVTVVGRHGDTVATIARIRPRAGTAVRTTIDPRAQRAAEAALAGQRKNAALVAVDASTGAVLAAVSVPASGFDLALDGGFPPGSSFKIVTSTALIRRGLTPRSAARCPASITVDGAVFRNSEGTGPVSDLLHAFAESCNTAFIGLATRNLTARDFPRTAALYGIGRTPRIGLPGFGGSVPVPSDEADLAATTIGQGRVLMSPLAMAMVAADVDTGTVHAPRLVERAGAGPDVTGHLPRAVVSGLHQMMARVVAVGTASRQGLPPGTYAKTGTAQYGTGHPLRQDAWLVGFNGPIAFAMVVVNGGEGGPTDGPLVARFLDRLR